MWRSPGLRRAVRQAALVTVPLVAALALRLPHPCLAVRLWLVALGAIAIGALAERALGGRPVQDGSERRLRWGWWRRPAPDRLRGLEAVEHAIEFSLATAFDVHYRLRPHLRVVAAHRLERHGVSLDREPRRARALLGTEAWDLVRPDRPAPPSRSARGLDMDAVRRVVERLDAL
jgi:hypothetical protein